MAKACRKPTDDNDMNISFEQYINFLIWVTVVVVVVCCAIYVWFDDRID